MKNLFSFTALFISFFIFNNSRLYAQNDFRNGFVIKNNGDTIQGFIDYKGNKKNTKKCIFRANKDSNNQVFTPDDIKAYGFVDSKFFVSKFIKSGEVVKNSFIEYLIRGIVSIYYCRDEDGDHYFVEKNDENIIELKNEEKEVLVNNVKYLKESKEFIATLKTLFKDKPEIILKVDSVILTKKSLINIARDYHHAVCSNWECITYEKKQTKTVYKYGIVIGLNTIFISGFNNKSHFTTELGLPNTEYYLYKSHSDIKVVPSIGLFLKSNLPFINENVNIQIEAMYSQNSFKTINSYNDPAGYLIKYTNDIGFTRHTLNSVLSLKYEFPKGIIRPTFQIGMFVNSNINTKYNRTEAATFFSGDSYYSKTYTDYPFNKNNYGLDFGLGLNCTVIKKYDIYFDLKYQRGIGLIKNSGLFNSLNPNYFLLNVEIPLGKYK